MGRRGWRRREGGPRFTVSLSATWIEPCWALAKAAQRRRIGEFGSAACRCPRKVRSELKRKRFSAERTRIENDIQTLDQRIKDLVPPPVFGPTEVKHQSPDAEVRHPSPDGKDVGKKAWAYFEQDNEYVEVTLTAYYPKEKRRSSRNDYVFPSPWRKTDAERGCYRMDYLLNNQPWSRDYGLSSDEDETVIMWPIDSKEHQLVATLTGVPEAPSGAKPLYPWALVAITSTYSSTESGIPLACSEADTILIHLGYCIVISDRYAGVRGEKDRPVMHCGPHERVGCLPSLFVGPLRRFQNLAPCKVSLHRLYTHGARHHHQGEGWAQLQDTGARVLHMPVATS